MLGLADLFYNALAGRDREAILELVLRKVDLGHYLPLLDLADGPLELLRLAGHGRCYSLRSSPSSLVSYAVLGLTVREAG
jgi:hypothetical protein